MRCFSAVAELLVYLGSSIDSGGRSTQEIHLQLGIGFSIMGRLSNGKEYPVGTA